MRIVGGSRRGLRLASVGKGDLSGRLRPTSDRVRESLFNILKSGSYGDPVTGSRVLDLFAGTGALGFEALSRGATHITFVDNGSSARSLILKNASLMNAVDSVKYIRGNATTLGLCRTEPFSLVFLDPPYGTELGPASICSAFAGGWLASDALVVWEDSEFQPALPGFALCEHRCYGGTYLTILRRQKG